MKYVSLAKIHNCHWNQQLWIFARDRSFCSWTNSLKRLYIQKALTWLSRSGLLLSLYLKFELIYWLPVVEDIRTKIIQNRSYFYIPDLRKIAWPHPKPHLAFYIPSYWKCAIALINNTCVIHCHTLSCWSMWDLQ